MSVRATMTSVRGGRGGDQYSQRRIKVEGGDPVKVEGEDPPTPGCLREDMMRRYVGDSQSWVRAPVAR